MRLWSIHPMYLDPSGLVAVWREALLAKKVLQNRTIAYKNHPQLLRFKKCKDPVRAIDAYLWPIFEEACRRGYQFDKTKMGRSISQIRLLVTKGQLAYETSHLLKKLKARNPAAYKRLKHTDKVIPHPMFKEVNGSVEQWEKVDNR